MFDARKIEPEQVANAIALPTNLAMERLRSDAETASGRGYHAYARILTDCASAIDHAQSKAIDELLEMSR